MVGKYPLTHEQALSRVSREPTPVLNRARMVRRELRAATPACRTARTAALPSRARIPVLNRVRTAALPSSSRVARLLLRAKAATVTKHLSPDVLSGTCCD